MARFLVNSCCRASIQERWVVEAESADEAMRIVDEDGEVGGAILSVEDEILGAEEDRTVESAQPIPELVPHTRIARFIGQAWIRNQAMEVDDSTVTFGITDEEYALAGGDNASDYDSLKTATRAPALVKLWNGPFAIEILDDHEMALLPDNEMPPARSATKG